MNNPSKNQEIWQTWWLIVGPQLPQSELRLPPSIALAPLTEREFQDLKKDIKSLVLNLKPPHDFYAVHNPPRDEVQSRYRLQIDVPAREENEAIQNAKQIADRLLVSLNLLIPGQRYFAEFRKFRLAGTTQEKGNWSETVTLRTYDAPIALDDADAGKVIGFMKTLEQDVTAADAYIHLLSAWQLQDTAGSKPLDRSILQHYVLSYEAVAIGLMSKARRQCADRIRIEERAFADEFSRTLANRADKAKAIREASTKLREIALVNMIPSLIMTADLLGISTGKKDQAIELYKLRSRSLSHPGNRAEDQMRKWLSTDGLNGSLADLVAREFLSKYCAYVAK